MDALSAKAVSVDETEDWREGLRIDEGREGEGALPDGPGGGAAVPDELARMLFSMATLGATDGVLFLRGV